MCVERCLDDSVGCSRTEEKASVSPQRPPAHTHCARSHGLHCVQRIGMSLSPLLFFSLAFFLPSSFGQGSHYHLYISLTKSDFVVGLNIPFLPSLSDAVANLVLWNVLQVVLECTLDVCFTYIYQYEPYMKDSVAFPKVTVCAGHLSDIYNRIFINELIYAHLLQHLVDALLQNAL